MHELSIAMSILDVVSEEKQRYAGASVETIHVCVGALSGVVKEGLLGPYDAAPSIATVRIARANYPFRSFGLREFFIQSPVSII